jgi:hypothetical protein
MREEEVERNSCIHPVFDSCGRFEKAMCFRERKRKSREKRAGVETSLAR